MPESAPVRKNERIEAALKHLAMGFQAFSVWSTTSDGVCKCVKGATCTNSGKHPIPQNGFLDSTSDPKRLITMLEAASEPNYGIVWPEGDDIVIIIDVDGDDWRERIGDLKAKYGPLPATKTTRTPSGGLHLFYRWPKGVPIPNTNQFHGFVTRFPWKGYVVGPESTIGDKTYAEVGPGFIATLPDAWVQAPARPSLIVVTGEVEGYKPPDHIPTGTRHDEITRFVASRWNKGISKGEIEAGVRAVLFPLMDETPDEAKFRHDVDEAWDTAGKKWGAPAGSTPQSTTAITADGVLIDPLAIESRIERPEPLDFHSFPIPLGLSMMLDHLNPLTDAPHTSLALTTMVTMSALVGPTPTLRWRGKHRCALFGCLVGHSGYGRKGASMRVVESAFRQCDSMMDEVLTGGVASGEVLVDILNESKKNRLGTSLIWEHEIANVLTIAAREGSILSGVLRKAWDGDRVESRSRAKGHAVAFGYNVAFMAGVTPAELGRRLSADDISNGWANRFLWFYSEKRPGGFNATADDTMNGQSIDFIQQCIEFGRGLGGSSMLIKPAFTMSLSPGAEQRLEVLAERLDVPPVGAIGSLRQRMPAHIIRLAMIAAILDMEREVSADHVAFGEAMAGYAVDSMRSVFGVRVDDPVAMLILGVLAQVPDGWLNTTDLKRVTGKEYSRTMSALDVLLREGLIVREERPTGGRPSIGYRKTL